MTPAEQALPWQAFGRDVRPATFFLMVNTCYVSGAAVLGATIITGPSERVIGGAGLVGGAMLVGAWWARSTRITGWGLQLACWLWLTVALHAALTADRPWSVSVVSGLCWAGVAGGLWLRDHEGAGRRDDTHRE